MGTSRAALVGVSPAIFARLQALLRDAGCGAEFDDHGPLDLDGIVLRKVKAPSAERDATVIRINTATFDYLEDRLRVAHLHHAIVSDVELDLAGVRLYQVTQNRVFRQHTSGRPVSVETVTCLACRETVRAASFTPHLRRRHGLSRLDYHRTYVDPNVPTCARGTCDNDVPWDDHYHEWRRYCSPECARTAPWFGQPRTRTWP